MAQDHGVTGAQAVDGDLDILNKPYNWEAPRVDVWLNNGSGKLKAKPVKRRAASSAKAGTGPSFKGPPGLQLYSMRFEFKKDVLRTLNDVQQFGFREYVGVRWLAPTKVKP
jgi:hypothetical protein